MNEIVQLYLLFVATATAGFVFGFRLGLRSFGDFRKMSGQQLIDRLVRDIHDRKN